MKEATKLGFGSLCAKEIKPSVNVPPHILPIYATSSFAFESIDQGIAIFTGKEKGHVYARYGNPTLDAVAEKITRMETSGLDVETEAIVCSSGMSAIHTLALSLLKPGDKILTQANLYGGTTELFQKVFGALQIEPVFCRLKDLEQVESHLRGDSAIRLIYFETPANPTLECVDIEAIAGLGRQYGVKTMADNTFMTPYFQRPFQFGVDFIIHSTTKFINGHGNCIAGIMLGRDVEFMRTKVWTTMKLSGTNGNPFDAWLVYNGMKTLHVRMDRHQQNATALAEFLDRHPKVERVNYLSLPGHPDHQLALKQMTGFGAMLSFELKDGLAGGSRFMNAVKMGTLAPTLGDIDTLILHPATMSHLNIPREVRLANGITDGLIRVSVGIEDIEDLIADFGQALDV